MLHHSNSELNNWFIRTPAGDTRGPFTTPQLQQLLATGRIVANTLISKTATGPFQPISQILKLEPQPHTPPPIPVEVTRATKSPINAYLAIAVATPLLLGLISLVLLTAFFMKEEPSLASSTEGTSNPSSTPATIPAPKESIDQPELAEPPPPQPSPNGAKPNEEKRPTEVALTFEEVVTNAEKSVCLIRGGNGTGSGFLFEQDKVMTNRHVTNNMLIDEIEVLFPSNAALADKVLKAKILYEDDQLDLAILQIPQISSSPLEFDNETRARFRRGRDIIAIGSPGVGVDTLKNAVSRGLLSSETNIDGNDYYQASISVNPGNSGGPILALTGKVVGMVTLKGTTVEGVAYAIPAHSLLDTMQSPDNQFRKLNGEPLELINKQHDARVIVNRITMLIIGNLIRFEQFVDNVFSGIDEHNLEAQEAFDLAVEIDADVDHSPIEQLESITNPALRKISSSRYLSDNIRTKVAEFWGLYRELKSQVDSPEGSANSMRAKLNELRDKSIRLRHELDALLDLPDP